MQAFLFCHGSTEINHRPKWRDYLRRCLPACLHTYCQMTNAGKSSSPPVWLLKTFSRVSLVKDTLKWTQTKVDLKSQAIHCCAGRAAPAPCLQQDWACNICRHTRAHTWVGTHTWVGIHTLWMPLWLGLDIYTACCWPLVLSSSAFPHKHTCAYTGLKVSLRAGLDSLVPPLVSSQLSGLSSSWPRLMATSLLSPTALTILVSYFSLKFTGDCTFRYALTHSSLSSGSTTDT